MGLQGFGGVQVFCFFPIGSLLFSSPYFDMRNVGKACTVWELITYTESGQDVPRLTSFSVELQVPGGCGGGWDCDPLLQLGEVVLMWYWCSVGPFYIRRPWWVIAIHLFCVWPLENDLNFSVRGFVMRCVGKHWQLAMWLLNTGSGQVHAGSWLW